MRVWTAAGAMPGGVQRKKTGGCSGSRGVIIVLFKHDFYFPLPEILCSLAGTSEMVSGVYTRRDTLGVLSVQYMLFGFALVPWRLWRIETCFSWFGFAVKVVPWKCLYGLEELAGKTWRRAG